jgi:hypothetical protein
MFFITLRYFPNRAYRGNDTPSAFAEIVPSQSLNLSVSLEDFVLAKKTDAGFEQNDFLTRASSLWLKLPENYQ